MSSQPGSPATLAQDETRWEASGAKAKSCLPKTKLSKSLSVKLHDKVLSKIRRRPKSAEDTVWMKTILLGDKCRAPGHDDHDGDQDEAEQAKDITPRSTAPRRKLLTSFSMKLPSKLTRIRSARKERREKSTDESLLSRERLKVLRDDGADDVEHPATRGPAGSKSLTWRKLSLSKLRISKKGPEEKAADQDSIWRKAIILGEKCHVPSDEEEPPVFDDKGNRKRSYRPRSQPVSRSSSFLNRDVGPN